MAELWRMDEFHIGTAGTTAQGLTEHLRCRDVELVGDDARKRRDEEDEYVDVAVEEGVCPDQENALGGDLVPHCQRNRNLRVPQSGC